MSSLPPKAPPFGTSSTCTFDSGLRQKGGHLTPIVKDALALGVEVKSAIVQGDRERGLRLQKEVLDALSLKGAAHDVCAVRQRLIDITAGKASP